MNTFNPTTAQPARERALWVLCFCYFVMGSSALSVIGALPAIADGLHVGKEAVARLVSIFALSFAFAAPLLQVVAARLPRRTLILGGLLLSALGSALSGLASDYATMFAARILVALGSAAIGPVASALGASLVARERQGRALATVFLGMTLASVVSTPLASWVALHLGWRGMFGGVAGLNLAAALAVASVIADRSAGQPLALRELFALLRRPGMAASVAVMLLQMSGLFASFTMIVPLLGERFAMPPAWMSSALMVFGLAGIVGNTLARRLADRWSADRSVAVALAALLAVFAAIFLAPHAVVAAFAVLIVWALANDLFMPAQQRRLVELAPDARGLVLALNASALYVGMSAGAFVAGQVATRVGLPWLPFASAALIATALGALALSRRRPALACAGC